MRKAQDCVTTWIVALAILSDKKVHTAGIYAELQKYIKWLHRTPTIRNTGNLLRNLERLGLVESKFEKVADKGTWGQSTLVWTSTSQGKEFIRTLLMVFTEKALPERLLVFATFNGKEFSSTFYCGVVRLVVLARLFHLRWVTSLQLFAEVVPLCEGNLAEKEVLRRDIVQGLVCRSYVTRRREQIVISQEGKDRVKFLQRILKNEEPEVETRRSKPKVNRPKRPNYRIVNDQNFP